MPKQNVFFWTLYDFANSIVTVVFFLYFSQWLVVEKGFSDLSYNLIFAVASFFLLITTPILGSMADKNGRQHRYLSIITVCTFVSYIAATLCALFVENGWYAALFFLLANYFYQFSFVFYNALLHYIAPASKWGRISGIGQAGNWLGQITGLVITMPFAAGTWYLFGAMGRAQTFLPAVLVFFLLSLPLLLFLKIKPHGDPKAKISIRNEYASQWTQFKDLIKEKNLRLFLLSYFFFNDAIITASNNFPIFLQNVYQVSDTIKSYIIVGILVTSVIGALASGFVADKIGLKKTLLIVIGSWVVLFPVLGLVSNFKFFVVGTCFMGFLFGSIWTITRATMTALTPKDKLNFGFSFYTLSERVSTFLGPLSWGLITYLFTYLGPMRYRIAVASMAIFVAIGFVIVRKIKIAHPGTANLVGEVV